MNATQTKPLQGRPVRGELLSVAEGAEYIHMSKVTFYACINKGEIPYFRLPRGTLKVDSADLDDLLRINKVPASHGALGNI